MSIECGECERDLRGGHDLSCSRHPLRVVQKELDDIYKDLKILSVRLVQTQNKLTQYIRIQTEDSEV